MFRKCLEHKSGKLFIAADIGTSPASILQSGGDAVEAIAEELEQEKTALMDMKQFMTKLLELMQDSSDASREADTGYERAVRNLGQGN